jgi:cell division septum initiation protein DivIVA
MTKRWSPKGLIARDLNLELQVQIRELKQRVKSLEQALAQKVEMKDEAMMEFVNKRISEINTAIRRSK